MRKLLTVALFTVAFQSASFPVWSQNRDQIVGTIFGLILNEAIKNGGSGNTGQPSADGNANAPRAVEGPQQPSMSLADRMAVQRALAAAGLYAGEIDGAIGPASRSAITAWQTSVGAVGSGYLTPDQADSLIAMAPAEVETSAPSFPTQMAAAPADPALIDTALAGPDVLIEVANGTTSREMRTRLYREFLLRYVFAVQERADDPEFIGRVLSRSARINAFADPRVAQWSEQASSGTEFERQKAQDAFALFLFEQMTDTPLSFVVLKRIPFPEYDFDRGRFPLDLRGIFGLNDPTYFGPGEGLNVLASPGRWANVSSVAMPEAEAEVFAKTVQAANGFADVVMRVTLSNFRQNAEGSVVSDLTVDSVSLHEPGDLQADIIGPTLLVVPDPQNADGAGTVSDLGAAKDAVESWARLGAPVADGRLVIPTENWEAQKLFEPALDYLALSESPDRSLSMSEIAYYGTLFLSEEEQLALFGGNLRDGQYGFSINEDEFALAEIRKRFEATYGPALRARAPQLPVPARLVLPVALGDYDFDREVFPVMIGRDSNPYADTSTKPFTLELTPQPDFRTLEMDIALTKFDLEMPVEQAKAMNARLKSDVRIMPGMRYDIYLAFDLTLDKVQAVTSSNDYGLMAGGAFRQSDTALKFKSSVSRVVIYEDAALTRPIQDLTLDRLERGDGISADAGGSVMPVGEFGSQTGMAAFALSKGADPTVLTENAEYAASATGADEFTRPEIVEELVAMVRSTPVPETTIFFQAQVMLGEYIDGAFPITNVQYFRQDSTSASGYMLPSDTANIVVDNIDGIKRLPLARDAARTLAKEVPSRTFKALLEVRLKNASVETTQDSSGRRRYLIDATAIAMHLARPGDETQRQAMVLPEALIEEAASSSDNVDEASEPDAPTAAAPEAQAVARETEVAPTTPEAQLKVFDVVGLRLGMSLDEAKAAIGAHMSVARVLEWRSESVPPNTVGEMVRLYINDSGNEFIMVNYGPVALTPSVTAVSRNLFLPVGAVSDGDLANQLMTKYGEPEPGAGWQWSKTPRLYGCADGGAQYTLSWVGAPLIEGAAMEVSPIDPMRASTDPDYAAEVLVLARSSNLMYGLGASGGADVACEQTVRSEIVRSWATHVTNPPIDGAVSDLFVTRLIDQKVMRQRMEEAMAIDREKTPKVEIKL